MARRVTNAGWACRLASGPTPQRPAERTGQQERLGWLVVRRALRQCAGGYRHFGGDPMSSVAAFHRALSARLSSSPGVRSTGPARTIAKPRARTPRAGSAPGRSTSLLLSALGVTTSGALTCGLVPRPLRLHGDERLTARAAGDVDPSAASYYFGYSADGAPSPTRAWLADFRCYGS